MPKKPITQRIAEALKGKAKPAVDSPPKQQIVFVGAALDDLRDLPDEVKDIAGMELRKVQFGEQPDVPVKPMKTIGDGGLELIVDTKDGWFRVFYVAKFDNKVYVLHSFQKKSNKTSPKDIATGTSRYMMMMQLRKKP